MLHATLIDTEQNFFSLKQEWNFLLQSSSSKSFFLTWEWLYNWWIHLGQNRELFIVIIRDDKKNLLGIGPFCINKITLLNIKYLSFLGDDDIVCSDYLDLIESPDLALTIQNKIISYLYSHKYCWDFILFSNLSDSSSLKNDLRFMGRVITKNSEECPYILLPDSNVKFLANLGRRTRRNIKNFQRRLNDCSVQFNKVNSQSSLNVLFDLHLKRKKNKSLNSTLFNVQLKKFLNSILIENSNIIDFYTLKYDYNVFAIVLFFHYKNNLFLYQGGFDNNVLPKNISIMTTLLSYCINDAINAGIDEIHFLRGETEFKKQFTDNNIVTETIICGSSIKFYFYISLMKLRTVLGKIIKSILSKKYRNYLKTCLRSLGATITLKF